MPKNRPCTSDSRPGYAYMAYSMIYTSLSLVCGILEFWNFIYLFILEALEDITSNFGIKLQHLNNHANL
jgi:hypothetical protein